MNVNQLRALVAVARYGSIRAAARQLQLSQPALTKNIQMLEHGLGVTLFKRHGKGVTLTEVGEGYLIHAEAALNQLNRGAEEIQRIIGHTGGSVRIGMSAAPSLIFLSDVIKRFRQDFPGVRVDIVAGNFPAIQHDLLSKRIDFSISPRPSVELGSEFRQESLFECARAVYCRKEHPLLHVDSLSDLLGADWIITGATGTNKAEYDEIFERYGLVPPVPAIQCEYTTALIALLAETDMISMLPRQWIESKITRDLLAQINVQEKLIGGMDICCVKATGLELSPPAEHLLNLIRRHAQYYQNSRASASLP